MKTLGGFCIGLLFAGALSAQFRSGQASLIGTFPSPAFTAGVPPAIRGSTYQVGTAVNPAGTGVRLATPFVRRHDDKRNQFVGVPYAVPVYVGGYGGGYNGYDDPSGGGGGPMPPQAPPPQQQQQPPNVVVVYAPPPGQAGNRAMPPQQPDGAPSPYGPAPYGPAPYGPPNAYPPSAYQPQPPPQQDDEPDHYLLAFKDHTIYSAVAYWVDGDTLHYFTAGNKHNQASLSLVDVELTERLNKDTGFDLKLRPAK